VSTLAGGTGSRPSGSRWPGSSRLTGGSSGSRRTCRGATPRWPTGIGDRIGLPSWSSTTPTPRRSPSATSARRRAPATAVFVALGTGVGSALLLDGVLFRGAFGVAPELGHLQVVPDGRPCPCGKTGCWERYCSGTALATTAVELMARDPGRSPLLSRLAAGDPRRVTGQGVAAARGKANRSPSRRWRTSRGGWGWGWRSSPTSSTPSWW
jgi:glucokinase